MIPGRVVYVGGPLDGVEEAADTQAWIMMRFPNDPRWRYAWTHTIGRGMDRSWMRYIHEYVAPQQTPTSVSTRAPSGRDAVAHDA
jgi:hypothetical protein